MGELLAILWPSHHERLCEGICRFFNTKVGCDFEISLSKDPHPIQAHSLILQIFCQTLSDSDSKQIRFEDSGISRDDLRCLIEFIYRGKTYVDRQKLDQLRKAAEKLGLQVFIDVINQLTKNQDLNIDKLNAKKISRTEEEHNYGLKRKAESEKNQNKVVVLNYDNMIDFVAKEVDEPMSSMENAEEIKDSKSENISENSEIANLKNKLNVFRETEVDYVCPICDKVLSDKYKFSHHLKCHSEPSVLMQCPHCPFRSRRLQTHLATRHQMDVEGNVLEKSFKCDECEYECVANFLLKHHKKLRHRERCHKCDECSVSFLCNSELVRHKKQVHSDERPFMCDTCGACFKTAKCLRAHNETHLGIKWVCDICGVKVSQTGVWRHKQLHVDGGRRKKFKCPLCQLPFRQKYNLKVHIKGKHKVSDEEIDAMINSGVINIPDDQACEIEISSFREKKDKRIKAPPEKVMCSICGITLSSKPGLYRHMKQHRDNVKRFRCPLCEFSTIEKHNLKGHLKCKHKMETGTVNEIVKNISGELPRVAESVNNVGNESEENEEYDSLWS